MYSQFECGICYRTYNAGRRCPRELQCKHSFCESCLLALLRPLGPEGGHLGADMSIACPLCRHETSVSGAGKVRAELRVDESVLDQLLAAGVLDQEGDDPEEEEGHVQDANEEGTLRETAAEERDSPPLTRGGRLPQSWRKVWRKISGKDSRQRGGQGKPTSSMATRVIQIHKSINTDRGVFKIRRIIN